MRLWLFVECPLSATEHYREAMPSASHLISMEEHRARILRAVRPSAPEPVPLDDALGLALAADIANRWPVPLFDNSAMDGYAVRRSDAEAGAVLRVVADVPAGSDLDPALARGEAARIMTGAAMPTDADAVVPLEDTDLGVGLTDLPERITVTRTPEPSAFVRRRGADAAAGSVVVAAGTELGPWQLSAIAAAGHDHVQVHRAPRVAVISTGSELVPPAETPRRGQIPESNSALLTAAVRATGADVVRVVTVPDDESALRAALVDQDLDAFVLSGGVSVGAYDVVKAVLSHDGDVRFDRVAMQPGKPQGFGTTADGTLVFCLPGNPVSVAVSFEMFVRPALRALGGHRQIDRPRVTRTAATSWTCPEGRAQILPVVVDQATVRPASHGGSGSHHVSTLAAATALAIIDADVDRVEEGDAVSVMMLP